MRLGSWLIEAFAAAFGKAIIDAFVDWVDRKEDEAAIRKEAVAEAQNRTLQDIAETADAQAKVNAADRGGARDVARRLRNRRDKPR